MELRELGDRLFRLHAKLIIALVLAGALAGLAIHLGGKPQYQASALLTMGVPDPQSAENAGILAATAQGIATGPQLVARAISEAGATGSVKAVAASVSAQTMGSSGVVMLSVTDPDPQVAVRLANALADGVVATRIALLQHGVAASLGGLSRQQAAVNAQISRLTTQIGKLSTQLADTLPQSSAQASAIALLNGLQARLTSEEALAAQIATQHNTLEAQQGPRTTVIDRAVSAAPIRGRTLIDTVLGGLLGLVLGIAIAASREVIRPSLVGAVAISRAIGTPLLGEMNTPPDSWTVASLPDAATYVQLAADSRHVQELRFAALEPQGRRRARMRMLEGPLNRLTLAQPPETDALEEAAANGRPAELADAVAATASPAVDPDRMSSPRTGLVVATPAVLKVADVDALTNFIWISGWILLGVIVYRPQRGAPKTAQGDLGLASAQRDIPAGHVEVKA